MSVRRHFVPVRDPDGGSRLVHCRVAGSGPPVLLVHQSPRSSAEFLPLLHAWSGDFTLIAPDTPGFGDSDPLPHARPEVEDYADALVGLLDVLGLPRVGAYGFHSGAIILVTAAKRHAQRFCALAAGGYAVWTEAERQDFGASYTPDFVARAHGEHLAWAWGRILEQGWFFPWYRTEDAARLARPHADPALIHPIVMEMLGSGNAFSLGYAAVLRARRDLPGPGQPTPPTLIAAYEGDPLLAHIDRLGPLPPGWQARKVPDAAALEAMALAHLRAHPAPAATPAFPAAARGFVHVSGGGFSGLLHWQGEPAADVVRLHAPGMAAQPGAGLALDLPGHGLSDDWRDAPDRLEAWADVVAAALQGLGARPGRIAGEGWSGALAEAVARRLGLSPAPWTPPHGDRQRWAAEGLPHLDPDRDGLYLLRAWRMVRAAIFFEPWFDPAPGHERAFDPAEAEPAMLARRHLALLRARAGRPLLHACLNLGD